MIIYYVRLNQANFNSIFECFISYNVFITKKYFKCYNNFITIKSAIELGEVSRYSTR